MASHPAGAAERGDETQVGERVDGSDTERCGGEGQPFDRRHRDAPQHDRGDDDALQRADDDARQHRATRDAPRRRARQQAARRDGLERERDREAADPQGERREQRRGLQAGRDGVLLRGHGLRHHGRERRDVLLPCRWGSARSPRRDRTRAGPHRHPPAPCRRPPPPLSPARAPAPVLEAPAPAEDVGSAGVRIRDPLHERRHRPRESGVPVLDDAGADGQRRDLLVGALQLVQRGVRPLAQRPRRLAQQIDDDGQSRGRPVDGPCHLLGAG